ncbi:MAG TPA: hypothetical protein VIV12_18255 [Streptosporangiaceae bacterium]
MQRWHMVSFVRPAAVALGLAFGVYFVFTSPYQGAKLWPVWAPLAVAFTGAAGAVFAYGIDRWFELTGCGEVSVRVRDAVPRVAAIGIVSALVLAGSTRLRGPVHSSWRHVALVGAGLLGSVTVALVMEAIRHVAGSLPAAGTRGEQAALLVRLRQLLQRLLAATGSVVALSTLAVGASVTLERDLAAQSGDATATGLPPQFALIFGGLGSLLVALFYIPAASALQRRGRRLCDELFPLGKADEASAVLGVAEDRHRLEQLLEVDRSVATDLQTGLAVLGPLIASAAATFLSP